MERNLTKRRQRGGMGGMGGRSGADWGKCRFSSYSITHVLGLTELTLSWLMDYELWIGLLCSILS